MRQKQIDKVQYKELYQHPGSKNYEVDIVFSKEFEIPEIYLDTIADNINVYGKTNPIKRQDAVHHRRKIDFLGNFIDEGPIYTVLKDGTLWYTDEYNNWIINGDNTGLEFQKPLRNDEKKDAKKWQRRFEELYNNASFVHEKAWNYYFKIEGEWYKMKYNLDVVNDEFVKKHPPKQDQDVRMIELQDISPKFFLPPEEREKRIMDEIEYESTYFEEVNEGLNQYNYSAGWWYLEIYMPFDTIRIKRYSNYKRPELKLYKIPAAYGGRNDVLFIVQKPEKLFPEQVGGMYVIRPRDAKQPERRYKSISYGDMSKGQPYILRSEETEEYKEWTADKKG